MGADPQVACSSAIAIVTRTAYLEYMFCKKMHCQQDLPVIKYRFVQRY